MYRYLLLQFAFFHLFQKRLRRQIRTSFNAVVRQAPGVFDIDSPARTQQPLEVSKPVLKPSPSDDQGDGTGEPAKKKKKTNREIEEERAEKIFLLKMKVLEHQMACKDIEHELKVKVLNAKLRLLEKKSSQ